MTSRFVTTLDGLTGFDPTYVYLDVADYNNFPAPWWARATNPWHAEFIARRKARPLIDRSFDLLLVHGWEMVVAFRDLARRLPAAAMMDSVPATINNQLQQRGFRGWNRRLSYELHHRSFANAAREFDFFLPKGSDCADSLLRDYKVQGDHCYITLAPQDLKHWTPGRKDTSSRIRLLFVGNDFARKGGDFLLRLYANHLSTKYSLTIASNDPVRERTILPPGVRWLSGRTRDQLLEVYRSSDIFVFPTQQDFVPQVLGEALAAGLPCLVTDIEGTRDLVHNGENGFLIPRDALEEVWAAQLDSLITNPNEITRMSACARRFAEQKLGVERFDRLVAEVIARLRDSPKNHKRAKWADGCPLK
jgi:glycosyltransferase involved in cell wall biosynthesis